MSFEFRYFTSETGTSCSKPRCAREGGIVTRGCLCLLIVKEVKGETCERWRHLACVNCLQRKLIRTSPGSTPGIPGYNTLNNKHKAAVERFISAKGPRRTFINCLPPVAISNVKLKGDTHWWWKRAKQTPLPEARPPSCRDPSELSWLFLLQRQVKEETARIVSAQHGDGEDYAKEDTLQDEDADEELGHLNGSSIREKVNPSYTATATGE